MKEFVSPGNFIKRTGIIVLIVLVIIGSTVFLFDPFFHYHKPWFGLKAVLNDKEYQCVGTLRNFDYDALLVGSSVMENNDNSWYDEAFGVTSIKAIRSYGATADLCYLMDVAYENHDIKRVFYNIDPSRSEEQKLHMSQQGVRCIYMIRILLMMSIIFSTKMCFFQKSHIWWQVL